jgi:hypothetical protein
MQPEMAEVAPPFIGAPPPEAIGVLLVVYFFFQ